MPLRRAAALSVVALLVACGSSDSSSTSSSIDSGAPGADTTIIVGPDGSSTILEVPSNNETPGDGATPGTDANSSATSGIDSRGPVGSFAVGILSPNQSSDVVVEIRQQSNAGPQQSNLDHLTSVLQSVSEKNVTVTGGSSIDGGAKDWSADELRALGDAGRAQGGGHAVVHLLFVHGSFGGDDSILGAAVQGDTAAIFIDQVHASATPLVGSSGIETAVTTHEVGHLLGLVDLVLHTGRQDPQHPGHSTNKNSVMYWAVESNLVADLLQGGPPRDFDNTDLADLANIRSSG